MHILVLPSFYPSVARPSTGSFFADQVQMLRRAGHQVGVLVAPRLRELVHVIQRERRLPDLTRAEREDTQLYRMYGGWFPRVFPLISAYLHRVVGLRAFAQYCDDQGPPDVIHVHNIFYSGYIAAQIQQVYDIPFVLTEHSSNFVRGRVFLPGQHWVARRTLAHCAQPLAVGESVGRAIQRYTDKTVETVGNVVDTASLDLAPPATDPFTVAIAARLIPLKRVDVLLRAFAAAFPTGDARLIIGGNGPQADDLKQLAAERGVTDRVDFRGWLDRAGMRQLYHDGHVLVSASEFETFGLTLAEAMSCGRPVIATRSGGPEGFVTEATGLLIPVDDVKALASAMQTMKANYTLYDPQAIRAYCVEQFGEAAMAQRLQQFYQDAIVGG